VVVIRYADDTIVGFQYQTDADHFLENLRERLGKFGLELHPDKTRRIEFGRFAEQNRERRGEGRPETFDFLGFQHISGKNGLGRFMVRRTTIRKRMRAKLRQITRYRETSRVWACSATGCSLSGGVPFADGARNTGSTGRALSCWPSDGSLNRVRSIPFLTLASPPLIRDKNRMR
jgi:hypothetical protein